MTHFGRRRTGRPSGKTPEADGITRHSPRPRHPATPPPRRPARHLEFAMPIAPPLAPMVARLEGGPAAAWAVTLRGEAEKRRGRAILDLGVGDPDFATPPVIVEAMERAVRAGRTHYAPAEGEPALREAIARTTAASTGTAVDPAQVHVFPGAQAALFATLMVTVAPGDEVIVLDPVYTTYPRCILAIGAVPVTVPLDPAEGFALDVGRIEAAITPKTRAVMINSPGNPTGAVFEAAAIDALAALCTDRGLWLVSDEVYAGLVLDGSHHSPLASPAGAATTIVVNSLSKSHAMTGWRIGWAVAPLPVAKALRSLSSSLLYGVNQFVQDAAVTALTDPVAIAAAAAMTTRIRTRRDAFVQALATSNTVRCHVPQGGMFVLVDVTGTGQSGIDFADGLLDQEAMVVVPGEAFGAASARHLRVGLMAEPATLIDAASRLSRHAGRSGAQR
ncbi:MAG: pyridoxal phosphate-dependent aminotransferase [Geminicoccaceae bacterium]|nr:MAG: pyridoxal phosphate-dependent aminotransferase [Geminicoccaceae bacterium]